jgi:hypothetical protein
MKTMKGILSTSTTKVEIDFPDQFIDNRSKDGIPGGRIGYEVSFLNYVIFQP